MRRKTQLILLSLVCGAAVAASFFLARHDSVTRPRVTVHMYPASVVSMRYRPAFDTAPAVAVAVPPTPRLPTYRVVQGDTLSGLALRSGSTVAALVTLNHLHTPDVLLVGQLLHLPAGTVLKPPLRLRPVSFTRLRPVVATAYRPAHRPAPVAVYSGSGSSFQRCVIARESGGNPQAWNPSGHWGLYQYSYSTWVANGGAPGDFGRASANAQTAVFNRTTPSAWSAYDGC